MSRKRYNSSPTQSFFRWLYFGIFLLVAGWLLASIFLKKSPMDILRSAPEEIEVEQIPYDTISARLERTTVQAEMLKEKLAICTGEKQYKKALVNVESNKVNMRSGPSLSSSVILQIPDSSIVQIQYFDTEKFILDGEYGSWCKILYAENEGWIWGNFLIEIE